MFQNETVDSFAPVYLATCFSAKKDCPVGSFFNALFAVSEAPRFSWRPIPECWAPIVAFSYDGPDITGRCFEGE